MSDNSQERIAKALEEKNEIIMGILYGILIASVLVAGFFSIMTFGQPVYSFINYDMLGNERPQSPTYAVAQPAPLDDCAYSDDEQLCYQMKRIADSMESDLIIEQGSMIVDPVNKDNMIWTLVNKETYFENNDKFHRTTIHNNSKYYYLGEEDES